MKKYLLVFVSVIALLYSCKKDNPSNNNNTNQQTKISGKWYYMQDTVLEYKNGVLSRIINQLSSTTIDPNYYIQFNSDGTGISSGDSGSVNFTYTLSNNKLTTNYPSHTESSPGGTITFPAFSNQGTVKMLADGRLELFYDDSTTDGSGNVIRDTEAVYYIKQ